MIDFNFEIVKKFSNKNILIADGCSVWEYVEVLKNLKNQYSFDFSEVKIKNKK